jgi:hypothetical protein
MTLEMIVFVRKNRRIIGWLALLAILLPALEASAMDWNTRKDVPQEEIARYATLVIEYVRNEKGWNPGEYRMRFITALADAPLAAFNVIHRDGVKDRKAIPPGAVGVHPLEFEVYIQTEEMRAFGDSEEFSRTREEFRKRNN